MAPHFSPDQVVAGREILACLRNKSNLSAVLSGYAGTGKTWLTLFIVKRLLQDEPGREVVYAANFGRATSVISDRVGQPASTVCKLIYTNVSETEDGRPVFSGLKAPCAPGGLVVVDEVSTIGRKLYMDMLKAIRMAPGAQYLLLGDPKQLPPVKDRAGPDLKRPDAMLTHVHRQESGSPVLDLATALREERYEAWAETYEGGDPRLQIYDSLDDALAWFLEHRRAGHEATLLCYTNATRVLLNQRIREALGMKEVLNVGETLLSKINTSKFGVMNGDTFCVSGLDPYRTVGGHELVWVKSPGLKMPALVATHLIGQERVVYSKWRATHKDALGEDDFNAMLHVDIGYTITAHMAQGSQWRHVGLVLDGQFWRLKERAPEEADQLFYTSATRTTDALALFYIDVMTAEEIAAEDAMKLEQEVA